MWSGFLKRELTPWEAYAKKRVATARLLWKECPFLENVCEITHSAKPAVVVCHTSRPIRTKYVGGMPMKWASSSQTFCALFTNYLFFLKGSNKVSFSSEPSVASVTEVTKAAFLWRYWQSALERHKQERDRYYLFIHSRWKKMRGSYHWMLLHRTPSHTQLFLRRKTQLRRP